VTTSELSEDAGAVGAAFLAGTQAGFWDSVEQTTASIKESTVQQPEQPNVETYSQLYEIYRGLYPRLSEVFTDLHPFQKS
jgi:sugar (pentulose or hexulose) kinase